MEAAAPEIEMNFSDKRCDISAYEFWVFMYLCFALISDLFHMCMSWQTLLCRAGADMPMHRAYMPTIAL